MHDQYIERAANGILHCWIEVPLKTAVQEAERVSRIGILLPNDVLGQFGVFNERQAIVGSRPQFGRVRSSLRNVLSATQPEEPFAECVGDFAPTEMYQ